MRYHRNDALEFPHTFVFPPSKTTEVFDWCIARQLQIMCDIDIWRIETNSPNTMCLGFKNEDLAMMFKLEWV